MALYIVSYDLMKPGQDYTELIARLRQLKAVRILLSDWLLVTTLTTDQVRDDLDRFLDPTDRIFVAELRHNAAWRNLLISTEDAQALFRNASG